MRNNSFLKLLCSIPVVLICLYYIPFLGICLLIFRYVMYPQKKNSTPATILVCGLLILIPKGVEKILKLIKFDSSKIPYFDKIVGADLYNVDFIKYSKFLITVGIIFMILSYVCKNLINKLDNSFKNYMQKEEQQRREISEKNDLIVKERKEQAQNMKVVKCPYCGASNTLTTPTGTCQFCRRGISVENK